MRFLSLLTILTAAASALPAQWANQEPPTNPSPRRTGAAVFDPSSNRVVIYGGLIASPAQAIDEMWGYTGLWTQISPVGATPRWGHKMVADTANNRLLTFGGRSPTVSALSDDTRVWDGSAWQQLTTTNAPSARFLYGMVYDTQRDRVVLFGGRSGFAPNNETWEFDGTDWTQIATPNAPAPREEMGMVYDASLGRVVLYGGCDESTLTVYGDTWWYDGSDWTDVSPTNSPAPRFRGSMVYDSDRSRSVYFGGYDGTQVFSDTLEYAGGEWVAVPSGGTTPENTTESYAAYSPQRGATVIFGGFGPGFSDKTWEFTGTTDGAFSLYGQSCDTLTGEPTLTATTPNIGTTLDLTVSNLGTLDGAMWAIGFSDQFYNGLPLPLDLAILGLPGCNLLNSADTFEIAVASNSEATYSLPIPNLASLVGSSLYAQALPFQLPLTFFGASKGGRALIGQ